MTSLALAYARSSGRLDATAQRQRTKATLIESQIQTMVIVIPPWNCVHAVEVLGRNSSLRGKLVSCVHYCSGRMIPNHSQSARIRGSRKSHGNSSVPSENAGQSAVLLHHRCHSGRCRKWKHSGLELHPEKRRSHSSMRSHHSSSELDGCRQEGRQLRAGSVQRRTTEIAGRTRSLIAPHKFKQSVERDAGLVFNDRPLAPARQVLATFPARIGHRVHTQKLCRFILGAIAAPFFQRICHRPQLYTNR